MMSNADDALVAEAFKRGADQYRRILLDLIAELREAHPAENGYCGPCTHWGAVNPWNPDESNDDDDRCPSLQAADRAEARLREVTGNE